MTNLIETFQRFFSNLTPQGAFFDGIFAIYVTTFLLMVVGNVVIVFLYGIGRDGMAQKVIDRASRIVWLFQLGSGDVAHKHVPGRQGANRRN